MSNLNESLKQILNDLEEKLKNKEDFEYVKLQIFNLYNSYMEELEDKDEKVNKKIKSLLQTQKLVEEKLEYLENHVENIEKELYIDDEESDFAITCPYCNNEFVINNEDLTDEITCPECNNEIELDWGDDNCDGNSCSGNCSHCHHDEDDDM